MALSALAAGAATRRGTEAYTQRFGEHCGAGHFSDFLNLHLKLSSIGLGTFPGAASDEVEAQCAEIVEHALLGGINVIDTAVHYRYGRALAAVRAGMERARAAGVSREQVFVAVKGGFLAFEQGPPQDPESWFDAHIAARGLGTRADLVGLNLLSPAYVAGQIDHAREALGLQTLDAFIVDQPEVHIAARGKELVNRRLAQVFAVLEQAVKDKRIGCYGIATFEGMRAETDAEVFQSITSMLGLAEGAARRVRGEGSARPGFRVIQLPFNPAMTEGFTRFSQATGQGNVASTLQAAHQLHVYAMASHVLGKGQFATADPLAEGVPGFSNPAQRAIQFARSTPGLGTSLVGVSSPQHLDDLFAVARAAPMARADYLRLYRKAE